MEVAPPGRPARRWERRRQISSFRVVSSLSWFWFRPDCHEYAHLKYGADMRRFRPLHSYNLGSSSPRPTHPFDAHHSVHPTSFYRYWMREACGTSSTVKCRARSHVPDLAAKFGAAVGRPIAHLLLSACGQIGRESASPKWVRWSHSG